MLAHQAGIAFAGELPLDRAQDGRHGDGESGMVGREREERPPAAEPHLEAGRPRRLDEPVPRQGRGARLQDEESRRRTTSEASGSSSVSTSWPAARGPYATSAATTGRRRSVRAKRG